MSLAEVESVTYLLERSVNVLGGVGAKRGENQKSVVGDQLEEARAAQEIGREQDKSAQSPKEMVGGIQDQSRGGRWGVQMAEKTENNPRGSGPNQMSLRVAGAAQSGVQTGVGESDLRVCQ